MRLGFGTDPFSDWWQGNCFQKSVLWRVYMCVFGYELNIKRRIFRFLKARLNANSVVCCAWGYAVILVTACFRFIVKCVCVRVLMEIVRTVYRACCGLYFLGRFTIYSFHHSGCHWDSTSLNYHIFKGNLALYMIDKATKRRCGLENRHFVFGAERNKEKDKLL